MLCYNFKPINYKVIQQSKAVIVVFGLFAIIVSKNVDFVIKTINQKTETVKLGYC